MKKYYILFILAIGANVIGAQTFENLSVIEAKDLIDNHGVNDIFTIIDVRTPEEYLPEHIAGAFMRDFYDNDFELQLDSLDKNRQYLIYCRSGNRSGQAFQLMQDLGFQTVYNMLGGMNSWNAAGYPVTDEIPPFVDIYESVTSSKDLDQIDFKIYPNPASNYIEISSSDPSLFSYFLFDRAGKLIINGSLDGNKIEVSSLSKGIYNIKLFDESNKQLGTSSILIQ